MSLLPREVSKKRLKRYKEINSALSENKLDETGSRRSCLVGHTLDSEVSSLCEEGELASEEDTLFRCQIEKIGIKYLLHGTALFLAFIMAFLFIRTFGTFGIIVSNS